MDRETKLALLNAAITIATLKPGEMLSKEQLIDRLRRPLRSLPPSNVIRHAYRYYVVNGGIADTEQVVSYEVAADLADTSVQAVRVAAHRGLVTKLTVYGKRPGVTLRSLADWRGWSHEQLKQAARAAQPEANLIEPGESQ